MSIYSDFGQDEVFETEQKMHKSEDCDVVSKDFHERCLQIEIQKRIAVEKKLKDCRNELCLRCGDYRTAHLGSCNGCRWKDGK